MDAKLPIVVALAALCIGAPALAQTVKERVEGQAKVETVQMTGEVVRAQGDTLLCKMQPLGNYSVFNVKPGREFIIDGQTKHISDLKPGTVLTGTIMTTTTPVTTRTTSTLNGTVWWAQGDYVILTLASGENKEYKVPPAYKFMVEGKPASVEELKPGMKVTATKITEEPHTEISTQSVVTGKAPK